MTREEDAVAPLPHGPLTQIAFEVIVDITVESLERRHPFEVTAELVFLRHCDRPVQLHGVLADEPTRPRHLNLCAGNRTRARFWVAVVVDGHRSKVCHRTRQLQDRKSTR